MPKICRIPGGRARPGRPVNTRRLRERFLIVCEGERTEPLYFENFRVSKSVRVIGTGFNTVSLIQRAIEIRNESEDKFDQVWCVFDKDSFSDENFNRAINLAAANAIKVAYSNEAFELWYLLHFRYSDSALSRNLYAEMLSKFLGFSYKKQFPGMHEVLDSRQADAIRNATQLLTSYNPHNPAKNNPCTTVHILVQTLSDNQPGSPACKS
jgi:hypothetical protein